MRIPKDVLKKLQGPRPIQITERDLLPSNLLNKYNINDIDFRNELTDYLEAWEANFTAQKGRPPSFDHVQQECVKEIKKYQKAAADGPS